MSYLPDMHGNLGHIIALVMCSIPYRQSEMHCLISMLDICIIKLYFVSFWFSIVKTTRK